MQREEKGGSEVTNEIGEEMKEQRTFGSGQKNRLRVAEGEMSSLFLRKKRGDKQQQPFSPR